MAISLVVALAAVSALTISRQGFSTVDAASQLRDNGRFVTDLIQRLGVQSGYKDFTFATQQRDTLLLTTNTNPDPNIGGFVSASVDYNNAYIDPTNTTNPLSTLTSRGTSCTAGVNGCGSDVLVLRFQTAETFPGSGVADKTMIDCAGAAVTTAPANRDDRMISILHVNMDAGEPTLMCTTLVPSTTSTYTTTALVRGVEMFQVLYGADGVTPGTASAPLNATSAAYGLLPKIFLRADQFGTGVSSETNNNWRRVRALRIGMVLRGPVNSAQSAWPAGTYIYPLGPGFSSDTGGNAMYSANDFGSRYTPAADKRLRQTVTFTVHLRNDQGS